MATILFNPKTTPGSIPPPSVIDDHNQGIRLWFRRFIGHYECECWVCKCYFAREAPFEFRRSRVIAEKLGTLGLPIPVNDIVRSYVWRKENRNVLGWVTTLRSETSGSAYELNKVETVENAARSLLKSYQTGLKDVILAAGLMNIVYLCEEKELITSSAKGRLVSSTTGQTEEVRAYQLLDTIQTSLGYDTVAVMDQFLCIIHEHGARSGQSIAKLIAGKFRHPLTQFSTFDCKKQDHQERPHYSNSTCDPRKIFDKPPFIEDVLAVLPKDCDCEEFRKALKIPPTQQGDLKDAVNVWIEEETSYVTWRNFIKALRESSRTSTARAVVDFLKQPSVYSRYIAIDDFQSLEDLGL